MIVWIFETGNGCFYRAHFKCTKRRELRAAMKGRWKDHHLSMGSQKNSQKNVTVGKIKLALLEMNRLKPKHTAPTADP